MITTPLIATYAQQKRNRDVVDSTDESPIIMRDVMQTQSLNSNEINQYENQQDLSMHIEYNNTEFSDIEEPSMPQTRTRSQSRAKENSIPPPVLSENEVIAPKKRVVRKKGVEKVRRRRAIKEDEQLTDDEAEYIS